MGIPWTPTNHPSALITRKWRSRSQQPGVPVSNRLSAFLATLESHSSFTTTFQGMYNRAKEFYARSLAIREKALGPNHPDVAQSLNNLGLLLKLQVGACRIVPKCIFHVDHVMLSHRALLSEKKTHAIDKGILSVVFSFTERRGC